MADSARTHLPPELWIDIFRFATYSPKLYSAQHSPFDLSSLDDQTHRDTLALKYAIALVCRLWRALSIQMLYEDVQIGEGAGSLQHTLESDSSPDDECTSRVGGWVRRACLSYTQSATPTSKSMSCIDILRHCPHLEVLVRPPLGWDKSFSLRYDFPASPPPSLLSVKRLDWSHNDSASRSGGINSLDEVLLSLPQLEYLSLVGDMHYTSLKQRRFMVPSLRVLALRRVNPIFVRQVCYWSLPSLSHVVVDAPPPVDALESIWSTFGSTIQEVEFGKHMRYMTQDYLSRCLDLCPELRTLDYHVFFTSPPHISNAHVYSSLERVGLNARHNLSLYTDEDPQGLKHVSNHIASFTSEAFPELKEFVLYGVEWEKIRACNPPEFRALEESVMSQGRVLRFVW